MGWAPTYNQEQPLWVVLRLGPHRLALSAAWVRKIAALPEVTVLPGAGPHLRGMVDIRGRVMPLMDLRRRLDLPSLSHEAHELIRELIEQERVHLQWLKEMESATLKGRPFALELDPGQCPFGRWLDRRLAEGGALAAHLSLLDSPHLQTHRAAKETADLLAKGQAEKAAQHLAKAQPGPLTGLARALERCRRDLLQPQREIALVMQNQGSPLALAVDEVEAVEPLEPSGVRWSQADLGRLNQRLLSGVARRREGGEVVFLLELDQLLEEGRRLIPKDNQAN